MVTDEELSRRLSTLKVIWFGMLVGLAVYLFIGLRIGPNIQVSMDKSTFGVIKTLLYLFTLVIIIITRYASKFIKFGKGQQGQATQNFGPATQNFEPLTLQKYTTVMMVAWALLESIGIFGLVLFLLGKNPMDLYLLIATSVAALLWYRPKKDDLIHLA